MKALSAGAHLGASGPLAEWPKSLFSLDVRLVDSVTSVNDFNKRPEAPKASLQTNHSAILGSASSGRNDTHAVGPR
jgi:hypothetical protein